MQSDISRSNSLNKTLLLPRNVLEELLSMSECLKAVEYAFKLFAEGKAVMPSKSYLDLPYYKGDFRAMPAYIDGMAGIKWVCAYPNNREQGLPSVMATIILCDPNNGRTLAVMDGTYITSMRTGAAGGVAAKYLARKNSATIGIVGAGKQAQTQLLAIYEVIKDIREVNVFDQDKEASIEYAEAMKAKLGLNIRPVATVRDAAIADILVTTTPSRGPVVYKEYIKTGTHINAIGADAAGKQELDDEIILKAKVFVDDISQACHSGEVNVPISKGLMKASSICSTLGEVVAGKRKGRESDEEITVFDSTGLAIQDIICAKLAYEKAKEKGSPAYELF